MVGRVAALLALLAALALYYAFHDRLWNASTWWDIAFIGLVVTPACLALVWLVLPLRHARGLLAVGVAFGVLAWAFHVAGWNTPENFAKLFGVAAVGFAFLQYFEALSWVVLVSLIIPWVDAYSVWRGPTKVIVTKHQHVFSDFSIAFPIPGERDAANLGLPDVLQHRTFVLLVVAFAVFEWMVRTGRLTERPWGYVFPLLCAVGGGLLLTHSHAMFNLKDEFLSEVTHAPVGILGAFAGWGRWLEVRLPAAGRGAGWLWRGCFTAVGLILMFYREG